MPVAYIFEKLSAGDAVLSLNGYALRRLVTYFATEGLLYSNGTGTSPTGTSPWKKCSGKGSATDTDIKIADIVGGVYVLSVGTNAFSGNTAITSVVLPGTIAQIETQAFQGCTNLTKISIEGTTQLKTIGTSAFSGCTKLAKIVIPDTVISVSDSAFSGCTNIQYAKMPLLAVAAIPKNSLRTAIVTSGIGGSIDEGAFSGSTRLESITLPFVGATPSSTSTESNTHFGYIFGASSYSDNSNYVPASLKTVVITNGQRVEANAFAGCANIESVVLSPVAWFIGDFAFYNCTSLKSVTIGEKVSNIGNAAFANCTSLKSVTLPASVRNMSRDAFDGCQSLESIDVNAENTAYKSVDGVLYVKTGSTLLRYPEGKQSDAFEIPSSVTSIGGSAFEGCTSLTSVTIPDSVTSIGDCAFVGCTGLKKMAIPDSVTSIGKAAFDGCGNLAGVYITDIAKWCNISFGDGNSNPLSIAKNLYLNGNLVTNLMIPAGVMRIGDRAFAACTSLTSATIPTSVQYIGDSAFSHCSALKTVYYAGTQAQWNAISKGDKWFFNEVGSATVHCSDGDIVL